MEKIAPLWPIGYEKKACTSFVAYLKYLILNFLVLDSGFESMNVFYCCVYNEIQYLYRRFNTTT